MKRLSLLDTINLRTTAVYRSPREIVPLGVVYGDLSGSRIPCTALDKDGYLYHVSDMPMQAITAVYRDGEPLTYGYRVLPAYQDETGRSIAVVTFDQPQYDKKITVAGKGAMNLTTGTLLESPSDLIESILLDIQGYDAGCIDPGELAKLRAACLNIRVALLLNTQDLLKALLDSIALNIHAHWLLSDGKFIMVLRGIVSDAPSRYDFTAADIAAPEITSAELLNEITVQYGYNWDSGKYTQSITKYNPLSKILYGTEAKSIPLPYVQSARQAEAYCDAFLRTYSVPQLSVTFSHDLRSILLEVGDRITLTDPHGIGENGFEAASGTIASQDVDTGSIGYTVMMDPAVDNLYQTELVNLSSVTGAGQGGVNVSYENGVATITIYADIQGAPPVEGANITISGIRKVSDKKGQVRFNLSPGIYTAYIQASGYDDASITFTV